MGLNATVLRESFQKVAPLADDLAERFYNRLFSDYPEQSARFTNTDFADQHRKLIAALSAVVRQLENEPALVDLVSRLGERHTEFDLTELDYLAVTESFLLAFADVLGKEVWTEEYHIAWREAMQAVSSIMLQSSRQPVHADELVSAIANNESEAAVTSATASKSSETNGHSRAVQDPPDDSRLPLPDLNDRSNNETENAGISPELEIRKMITATQQDQPIAAQPSHTDESQRQRESIDFAGQVDAIRKSQAVIEFELDGTILYANENFLHTVGYSLDEIKGQHHRMFVEDAYGKSAEYRDFWARLNRGEYIADEFKRFGKEGKEVWIQASYNPILDVNGKPFKVVKYATDVTQEKLKTADISGQIEAIGKSQAVIEFNMDGTIVHANENFLNTLGYSLNEIKGQHHRMFVEEDYGRSPEYKDFWAGLNRGEFVADTFKRIGKGGKIVWIQASYNPILDLNGKPFKVVKYASDVTEQIEMARAQSMVENLPINVALANRDFELIYLNPASVRTLKMVEHLLPKPVDQLLGQSIDIFHKKPEYQRQIVSDPSNLPHEAKIKLGEETLNLLVSAIYDRDNSYIGPMITWDIITANEKMAADVSEVVKVVSSSATEMQAGAKNMAATSEQTARQSQVVAAASEEATRNVETVSSAAEELTASISEISRHVQDASKISQQAVQEAASANNTVKELGESSNEIGKVIKVITSIAQQTNLLALNATIEAARAGEAGKGFAVVANEVKELARQTAKATEEISQKIEAIQGSTNIAVNAIGSIGEIIGQINEISTTIAGAVEEQTAATSEISRNVSEAAKGTAEVSQNIAGVSNAAEDGGKASADMLVAADGLSAEAERLQSVITEFLNR